MVCGGLSVFLVLLKLADKEEKKNIDLCCGNVYRYFLQLNINTKV